LIPPTLEKGVNVGFLAKLWEKARFEVACATELVFVGYSLSESDTHIRELVEGAIRLRQSGKANHHALNQVMVQELAAKKGDVRAGKVPSKGIELQKCPLKVRVVCGRDESGEARKRYGDFFGSLGLRVEAVAVRAGEYFTQAFLRLRPKEVVFS
jgi:hypothetical protein